MGAGEGGGVVGGPVQIAEPRDGRAADDEHGRNVEDVLAGGAAVSSRTSGTTGLPEAALASACSAGISPTDADARARAASVSSSAVSQAWTPTATAVSPREVAAPSRAGPESLTARPRPAPSH